MRRMMRRLIVVSRYRLKSTPVTVRTEPENPFQLLFVDRSASSSAAGAAARYGCPPTCASCFAISSGGRMKSTHPLSMALCGMPACRADSSRCANVIPPTALISHSPSVPSEPVPERTTPIARAFWSCARERNRKSIGRCGPCPSLRGVMRSLPPGDRHVRVRRDDVDAVRLRPPHRRLLP